jgi:hypothetical protein
MTSGTDKKSNVPISQDKLARSFIDERKDVLRFVHDRRLWMRWSGALWGEDVLKTTFNEVRTHIDQSVSEDVSSMRTASFTAGVEKFAEADPTCIMSRKARALRTYGSWRSLISNSWRRRGTGRAKWPGI